MNDRLAKLGFTERILGEANRYPGLLPARVIAQYRELYRVATGKSEILAEISGKLLYSSSELPDYPAVGDFVMIDREDGLHGNAVIHHLLPRKSAFVRRAAGTGQEVQVVATNIDTVFVCMSLNRDFNLRRVERYLSLAWASGATPVVVLTKSDLCEDLAGRIAEVGSVAAGADVVVTSGMTDGGYEAVSKYIPHGRTAAFLGSSGVGKSTLINRLLGEDAIQTMGIRKGDKGKHTTTRRELFLIPGGGAVIDTPGMREIGVESADLGRAFADIDELAEQCRFSDCRHENEPGCAVRSALEEGKFDEERLESYKKLKKEARYEGLTSRQIESEKIDEMFSGFGGMKNARDFIKWKTKNR